MYLDLKPPVKVVRETPSRVLTRPLPKKYGLRAKKNRAATGLLLRSREAPKSCLRPLFPWWEGSPPTLALWPFPPSFASRTTQKPKHYYFSAVAIAAQALPPLLSDPPQPRALPSLLGAPLPHLPRAPPLAPKAPPCCSISPTTALSAPTPA